MTASVLPRRVALLVLKSASRGHHIILDFPSSGVIRGKDQGINTLNSLEYGATSDSTGILHTTTFLRDLLRRVT